MEIVHSTQQISIHRRTQAQCWALLLYSKTMTLFTCCQVIGKLSGTGLHLETFLGGGGGETRLFSMHTIARGVWGHAPPGNFCILDSLRLLLVHSQVLHYEYLIMIIIHVRRFLDFMRVILLALWGGGGGRAW